MLNTNHRIYGRVAGLLLVAISLLAATTLFFNRQYIQDQVNAWQFEPSSAVQQLATLSGMNQKGEFYFYASRPSLETAADFNAKCDKKEENTAVLGCYTGQRIYIYDVTDERLDGIRSVTAAHEMLHAVYERMTEAELDSLNKLLEAEYAKLRDDPEFAKRMEFYARTEPGQRDNELHSIIGTEVASISPALETYYKKYFSNRGKVVALHASYSSVFESLQKRGEELSSQLHALGNKIEEDTAAYNEGVEQLNANISEFNSRAEGGGFDSQAQFNGERAALLARADELNMARTSINSDIRYYETLRQELAGIASQSQELNRSINSSLAPPPSL